MELSPEQAFELRKMQVHAERMSRDQLVDVLMETYRLMLLRDAFYRRNLHIDLPAFTLPE
jgi:hypothetical protein